MLNVLQTFSSYSGLSINNHKSNLFFSNSCNPLVCQEISKTLGISQTKDLGSYLGFPLLLRQPTYTTFQPLLNKIAAKLSLWKSKMLNLVGRLTLAKFVRSSIPIYTMQCISFPKKTTNFINNTVRHFIWVQRWTKGKFFC